MIHRLTKQQIKKISQWQRGRSPRRGFYRKGNLWRRRPFIWTLIRGVPPCLAFLMVRHSRTRNRRSLYNAHTLFVCWMLKLAIIFVSTKALILPMATHCHFRPCRGSCSSNDCLRCAGYTRDDWPLFLLLFTSSAGADALLFSGVGKLAVLLILAKPLLFPVATDGDRLDTIRSRRLWNLIAASWSLSRTRQGGIKA